MAVTPDSFRAMAMSFERTEERLILDSREFRVRGRAFATLGWPDAAHAVLQLDPDIQPVLIRAVPGLSFEGRGRGRRGVTLVILDQAQEASLFEALHAAWRFAGGARSAQDVGFGLGDALARLGLG